MDIGDFITAGIVGSASLLLAEKCYARGDGSLAILFALVAMEIFALVIRELVNPKDTCKC